MTDVVEKAFNAFTNALASQPSGVSDYDSAMGAALATLTPGSTWTTDDGVEVMVVRRDALSQVVRKAFSDGYEAGVDEMSKLLSERSESMAEAIVSAIRKE